jgi:hypothetical protein
MATSVMEILTKRELSKGIEYFMPAGKWRCSSSMRARTALAVCMRVAAGRKLHAHAGGRLAVQARFAVA